MAPTASDRESDLRRESPLESRLIHLGPPGIGKSTLAFERVLMDTPAAGGDAELARCHAALERLLPECSDAVVIDSVEGDPEHTYGLLVESLG